MKSIYLLFIFACLLSCKINKTSSKHSDIVYLKELESTYFNHESGTVGGKSGSEFTLSFEVLDDITLDSLFINQNKVRFVSKSSSRPKYLNSDHFYKENDTVYIRVSFEKLKQDPTVYFNYSIDNKPNKYTFKNLKKINSDVPQ